MDPSPPTDPLGAASDEAVFDASVLTAMFGDEHALIASILGTFVSGNSASLAELVDAVAVQDVGSTISLAHKIAGASRMSGALAMGQCARNLEHAAKRGDAAAFPQAIADLQGQWVRVQAAIAAQLNAS